MNLLDKVIKMKKEGKDDKQIAESLHTEGSSYKDISQAIEQSKIKDAVESDVNPPSPETPQESSPEPSPESYGQAPGSYQSQTQEIPDNYGQHAQNGQYPGMQQSVMNQKPGQAQEIPQAPAPTQDYQQYPEYNGQYQQQDPYGQYAQYSPTQSSGNLSPDTMTEIAEQVLSERMDEVRKRMEKIADFKNTTEAKLEYLDERLKRMEKIIDNIQSSVLKRVGDYITDVKDIKTELIETQKTFSKLAPEINKTAKKHKTSHHTTSKSKHKKHTKKKK